MDSLSLVASRKYQLTCDLRLATKDNITIDTFIAAYILCNP